MKYLEEHRDLFNKLLTLLENHMGSTSEIVLQDFSDPHEPHVFDIRNGHISGRKIGDGLNDFWKKIADGRIIQGDRYNYISLMKSDKILRSSRLYIYDNNNIIVGCLCINTDITNTIQSENLDFLFKDLFAPAEEKFISSPAVTHVEDLLDSLISESQALIGKTPAEMSRLDKIQFIQNLDKKGAFLISKSGEKVCRYLGISKYTLYKYLDNSRENT